MSFKDGDRGEFLWGQHLEELGVEFELAPKKVFPDWDIKTSDGTTYEVKYDVKAMYWAKVQKRLPNLYLEFWNTKQDKPSGILTSKATYLIYIIKKKEVDVAYCFDTKLLLLHLDEEDYEVRENKSHGDSNAKGYCPPVSALVDHEESGFIKKVVL